MQLDNQILRIFQNLESIHTKRRAGIAIHMAETTEAIMAAGTQS